MFQRFNERGKIAKWLSAGVVAGACLMGTPHGVSVASARPIIDVRIAPPAPRVEVVPARPSPRHVWTHGYWAWNGHAHYWVPGRYMVQRPGYAWREQRWEEKSHGHWRSHDGGWYRR